MLPGRRYLVRVSTDTSNLLDVARPVSIQYTIGNLDAINRVSTRLYRTLLADEYAGNDLFIEENQTSIYFSRKIFADSKIIVTFVARKKTE